MANLKKDAKDKPKKKKKKDEPSRARKAIEKIAQFERVPSSTTVELLQQQASTPKAAKIDGAIKRRVTGPEFQDEPSLEAAAQKLAKEMAANNPQGPKMLPNVLPSETGRPMSDEEAMRVAQQKVANPLLKAAKARAGLVKRKDTPKKDTFAQSLGKSALAGLKALELGLTQDPDMDGLGGIVAGIRGVGAAREELRQRKLSAEAVERETARQEADRDVRKGELAVSQEKNLIDLQEMADVSPIPATLEERAAMEADGYVEHTISPNQKVMAKFRPPSDRGLNRALLQIGSARDQVEFVQAVSVAKDAFNDMIKPGNAEPDALNASLMTFLSASEKANSFSPGFFPAFKMGNSAISQLKKRSGVGAAGAKVLEATMRTFGIQPRLPIEPEGGQPQGPAPNTPEWWNSKREVAFQRYIEERNAGNPKAKERFDRAQELIDKKEAEQSGKR